MIFDIRTLVVLFTIVTLVSAVALFLFYRLLSETPGLKYAAMGASCQAMGSIFLIVRDSIDPMLSIMVSNGGYFFSYAFYYQATRLLSNQAAEWRWPGAVIGILLPMFLLFPGNENLGERIVLNSLGISLLSMLPAWMLWKDKVNLPGRRSMAIIFAIVCLISVLRIISVWFEPIESISFLDLNSAYLIFIWATVASIATTIGLIVMTSERLREQLKHQLNETEIAREIADRLLHEHKNFLVMLSHEFKTPLSIIRANADTAIAIDKQMDPFVKDSLQWIQRSSDRLTELVDTCLNEEWMQYTLEAGELSVERLNLNDILSDLCQEYRVNFVEAIPDRIAEIEGDRSLMTFLFSSLIDNALKYSCNKDLVEVKLFPSNEYRTVEIFDDGPGVEYKFRDRIFDKYYRVQNSQSQSGSGLGLFFVKRIVEKHGGSISVECDHGTIFRVILPVLRGH
ncbi:HAMP domain-containing sensor histidine kinase [uncultured Amphritea sp.]|uniref:sensor histidine kinase n=1 Tax=uncultured Amphritea sp. TaxID=981605 RepID=UPI002609AED6|nr:HAMP domain-containing sensor histidine kinase [uncultured Amphritea sp.]